MIDIAKIVAEGVSSVLGRAAIYRAPGLAPDAPGTAGVNAYLFNRLLNTASPAQADWETTTRIGAMSSGIMRARSEGNSGEGIGSSETRYFAMDFTSSKLLRVALLMQNSSHHSWVALPIGTKPSLALFHCWYKSLYSPGFYK